MKNILLFVKKLLLGPYQFNSKIENKKHNIVHTKRLNKKYSQFCLFLSFSDGHQIEYVLFCTSEHS